MKVSFYTHAGRDGLSAVYRYYSERVGWLEEAGHEAEVVSFGELARSRFLGPRWRPVVLPREVARHLGHSTPPPDVAVFHSYAGSAVAGHGGRSARAGQTRLVTQFHGLEPLYHDAMSREMVRRGRRFSTRYRLMYGFWMPRMLRRACRGSDLVLCLNTAERREIVRRGWASEDRVVVFPSQVEDASFVEHPFRARVMKLLFVGQWLEGKGTAYLAEAFGRLAASRQYLELGCVGTRQDPERVLASFPAAVRDRVSVRAQFTREQLPEIFREADIFVFPSLSEGFSLALLEAMAAGLPIVCTPVGSAADLLEADQGAVLVPPADSDALVGAIEHLLDDQERRRALGSAAQTVARKYRVGLWKPRFVELLTGLSGPGT